MKNRAETSLRLYQMNELSPEGLLSLAQNLCLREDYQKAYEFLSDKRFEGDASWMRRRARLIAEAEKGLGQFENALETLRPTLPDDKFIPYIFRDVKDMEQWNFYGQFCMHLCRFSEAEESFLHGLCFGTPEKNICSTALLYLLVECARRMKDEKKERLYTIMLKTIVLCDTNSTKEEKKTHERI